MMVSAEETISDLRRLIDARVGIITDFVQLVKGVEEPPGIFLCRALLARIGETSLENRAAVGKGDNVFSAMMGAFGEAVERYCALQNTSERITVATYGQVKNEALHPESLPLYSDQQYSSREVPYPRYDDAKPLAWYEGRIFSTGGRVLIPASAVLLGFTDPYQDLFAATSNGLAAGCNLPSALLSGLYELIERDAFVLAWFNQSPAIRICDATNFPPVVRHAVQHYARFKIALRLVKLPTDMPAHVVLAATIDSSGLGPYAAIGLGCDVDFFEALKKAVFEVCQSHQGENLRYRRAEAKVTRAAAQVRLPLDHSALYWTPENCAILDSILESAVEENGNCLNAKCCGSASEKLSYCSSILSRLGCSLLYAETTSPDIEPFGLHSVRVIVPGLQPIHFGFHQERLGGQWPRRGIEMNEDAMRIPKALNRFPHPLS